MHRLNATGSHLVNTNTPNLQSILEIRSTGSNPTTVSNTGSNLIGFAKEL